MVDASEFWQDGKTPTLSTLSQLMLQLRDAQVATNRRLDAFEKREEERDRKMTAILDAFPEGDLPAHKLYHEIQIEILEEKRRLRAAIVEKTISGLVWAALVGAATIGWKHIVEAITNIVKH